MSVLRQRLMYPQKGERVEIYKKGNLIASGVVINSDKQRVSVMGNQMVLIDGTELYNGINDGSMTVKKLAAF